MKTVVLGVSAGIAAYKACDVLRELRRAGCAVHVVLTERARSFVGPLTFEALSGRPVVTHMLAEGAGWDFQHIRLAREADLLLVAPCTADLLGRLANGIADDFLTTFFTATEAPVLLAPSMNTVMWSHDPVRRNVSRLRELGVELVGPEAGELACGEQGAGRLAPVEEIVSRALQILGTHRPGGALAGKRLLVTAGPTAEDLDPVRTLTNRSSGRMGFALAREAHRRGAEVVLVHGPVDLEAPEGIETVPVRSALEMRDAVLARIDGTDVCVAAAAVADYRPAEASSSKIKKRPGEKERTLLLVPNPDILEEVSTRPGREGRLLVGFALETEDLEESARAKLDAKGLDLIVANDASAVEALAARLVLLDREGGRREVGPAPKVELAVAVLDRVEELLDPDSEG